MNLIVIQQKIFEIRNYKVMLASDLALLYGVETRTLNQAVQRNADRFPDDFMFRLTMKTWRFLRSQFVILRKGTGRHPKYLSYVFTEHGVTMLASILKSERAVKMSIAIVRAFIAIRQLAMNYREVAKKITELELRYNKQFKDVYQALKFLMDEKSKEANARKRKRIGFNYKRQ